ncbi:MAG: alkaline phosphatase D family protein [Acidimicrobiales bacterium]
MASADPGVDRVVIWTRAARPGRIRWRISSRDDLSDPVASGDVVATHATDQTVMVDVTGLEAGTTYWYGFITGAGQRSPTGRTRTAAMEGVHARIAVVGCASLRTGYFTAYRHVAARELDLVLHVGDYIYESGRRGRGRAVRGVEPDHACVTLGDYRARHAQYRSDPDLRLLHAAHPVAAIWDDHDLAGSTWSGGAGSHDPNLHGPWPARVAAAVAAWREWVPLRSPDPAHPSRIHRSISLGGAAQLLLLDTRLAGRDRPAAGGRRPVMGVVRRRRSLLGDSQWEWLESALEMGSPGRSPAPWQLVASPVVCSPMAALRLGRRIRGGGTGRGDGRGGGGGGGLGINPDQWDGYPAERSRLLAAGARNSSGNPLVILAGDLHSSWAGEIAGREGNGDGAAGRGAAVEFVTPAVSSTPFARLMLPALPGAAGAAMAWAGARWMQAQNPHLRFCDLVERGYLVLDIRPERIQADWWHLSSVASPNGTEHWAGGWVLPAGSGRLTPAVAPADGPLRGAGLAHR